MATLTIADHVYYPVLHRNNGGGVMRREDRCFTCGNSIELHSRRFSDLSEKYGSMRAPQYIP